MLFAQKGFDENQQFEGASGNTYEKVAIQLGSPYEAADVAEALMQRYDWLADEGYGLSLAHERESRFARHFAFDQDFKGIPIYHRGVKANVGMDGGLFSILNNLGLVPHPAPAAFQLTEADVIAQYREKYDQGESEFELSVNKTYFVDGDLLVPAFRVDYSYGNSLWEDVVDARDFRTYSRRDLGSYHHSYLAGADTNGTAMVFSPDPLTSSGNAYGSSPNWQDNNDADNPDLNGERISVVLQDISYDAGIFRLEGPYAKVTDLEAPNTAVVTSTDGTFNFTRSQSGFEDVMCYYHIDTYQRYIQSRGFNNLYATPLNLDPHGLNGQDNSHFVPSGGSTRLAFGEGCVDDAEDADVIVHEYGHALSFSGSPGTNSGTERQGLDEGIGDYIAASYSKSLHYQFWKNTFTWDGHNDCWSGRSASDPTPYPPSSTNIYVFGAIWASTLMEVHDQIGREQSDVVFFQSLFGNFNNMTLTDAARVVLDADSLAYGLAHEAQYKSAFCSRGILTGVDCIVGRPDPSLERPVWAIFPNPSEGAATIFLEEFRPGGDYSYQVTNLLGQVLLQDRLLPSKTDLPTESLDSGVYLVRILDGTQQVGTKKLVLQR